MSQLATASDETWHFQPPRYGISVIFVSGILISVNSILEIVDDVQNISEGLEKDELHFLLAGNSGNVALKSNILLVESQSCIKQGLS